MFPYIRCMQALALGAPLVFGLAGAASATQFEFDNPVVTANANPANGVAFWVTDVSAPAVNLVPPVWVPEVPAVTQDFSYPDPTTGHWNTITVVVTPAVPAHWDHPAGSSYQIDHLFMLTLPGCCGAPVFTGGPQPPAFNPGQTIAATFHVTVPGESEGTATAIGHVQAILGWGNDPSGGRVSITWDPLTLLLSDGSELLIDLSTPLLTCNALSNCYTGGGPASPSQYVSAKVTFNTLGDTSDGDPPVGETPLPGAAILMGSVLAGGVSVGAWRRRRQNRAA